jgi:hypothetical protein
MPTTRNKHYHSAEEIEVFGLELLFGETHRIFRRKETYRLKQFKVHYGKDPTILASVWRNIIRDRWVLQKTNQKPKLKHFLWAFYNMQVYPKEHNAAATFTCDEKTWRKWTRIYAEAVARLVGKYVSRAKQQWQLTATAADAVSVIERTYA